jgi:adenylate kinase family enzyme
VILGCAGTGKTTLAQQLGDRTTSPVICLDTEWRPYSAKEDVASFRSRLKALHSADAWISDGNFADATFDIRIPRADLIVWMERPRTICAWRVIARVFRPGESHRINDLAKVLRFIWHFDRINRPLIEARRIAHGAQVPVCRLTSDRKVAAFLSSFGPGKVACGREDR